MDIMDEDMRNNILIIFIISIGLLGIIIFLDILNLSPTDPKLEKTLTQVVTLEAMEPMEDNLVLNTNAADSFCKTNIGKGDTLEESCNNLTKTNCNTTSCCVYLNDTKCVAGAEDGPTFQTAKNGEKIKVDYYYYKAKCFGNCDGK